MRSILVALFFGAILIMFSDPRVMESLAVHRRYPADFFSDSGQAVWDGYSALAQRLGRHLVRRGSRPSSALRH